MPENCRPNLVIPITLWGEVKVAAFRRGVRPVQVVIECLREKFTEPVKEAGKRVMSGSARMNSEVAGKSERDKQMEEIPPVKVNPPISKPAYVPPKIDQSTCKHPRFMPNPNGIGSMCVSCNWVPPL